MLNHIVMWKIKEDVADKEKVKLDIKNNLEGLFSKIQELREIKVERFMETTSTHDIALFVKVDNEETLRKYATNPLHVEVIKTYIKPYVYDRVCVDFFE
ncbi:MAG: Dabb family protein [Fusobacterium sp.]|uniref:Dabb family protein n=1 Tax=Fusobacterium sp. TaxID=68766 RepID=UPI003FA097FF